MASADETKPSARVFVEWSAPHTAYVGQKIGLTLRFGVEEPWFDQHAVDAFARPLDLPLHVKAPGLDRLEGARPIVTSETGARKRVALNDATVGATRVADLLRDGRHFSVFEITRSYVLERAGRLEVEAARIHFLAADRFEEDVVRGKVPVLPQDADSASAPLLITVLDVPVEGRPPSFRGAVGRFSLAAEADRTDMPMGETFHLTLRLEGDGDVGAVAVPRPDESAAIHVFGVRDDHAAPKRTVVYDVALMDARATEIPAFTLAYFDPEKNAFETARTATIPLHVRAAPSGSSGSEPASGGHWLLRIGVTLAAVVLAGVLLLRPRRPAR